MFRALLFCLLAIAPRLSQAADGAVAVLYFDNQGNADLEPLKVGLAQMLITDLQQAGDIPVVERARIQAVLDELELGHNGMADPTTAARIGKLLGAEWLVLGSYFDLMGTLRVDTRVVRVETGEIVHTAGQAKPRERFQAIEDALATELIAGLRALHEQPNSVQPEQTRSGDGASTAPTDVVTPDADAMAAAVHFSEGLIALDQHDSARARDAFTASVAADPTLTDAQTQLAALEL